MRNRRNWGETEFLTKISVWMQKLSQKPGFFRLDAKTVSETRFLVGIKDLGEQAPTEISCFHSQSQISNPKLVLSITSSLKMV